ncbi:MAG TPA: peptidoglycan bridge formation glycyltransferase FemA/FemB family protein, partial [Gemmatimonadales bacterium]|nr:peptidoglycan bridge formation glycyltransferase FemA/FemB family protein [Gemmatimonadales bacterium]
SGTLYFAELGDRRLAAAITIHCGGRATYFFGASHPEGREHMAPYLLQFEMMRRAKARHCAWYDLWGIAPRDAPGHRWAAISEFKLKFGGRRLSLVPTLDLVLDRDRYQAYRAEREHQGDVAAHPHSVAGSR